MTVELDDPGAYGRIVRDADGDVERIVETKDPAGVDARRARDPRDQHRHLRLRRRRRWSRRSTGSRNDNSAGEYYLGDVLPMLREAGLRVTAHRAEDPNVNLGVNTRADLAAVAAEARRQILERHMLAGVTIVDPASTWIDAEVEIARRRDDRAGTILRGGRRSAATPSSARTRP